MLSNQKFMGHSQGMSEDASSMERRHHKHRMYHKAQLHQLKAGSLNMQHNMSKSRIRPPEELDKIEEVEAMEELGLLINMGDMEGML